jgi:capsule polysaccharide export protein KpsC/LpsZ
VIRTLSCVHGFGVVAVENTFNNNKIVWDDVSGITVNKNLAKNYFWKYRDVIEASMADQYVRDYLLNVKKMKSTEHQTPSRPADTSAKKTVLFLGQVYSDSSLLFGINDFSCPIDIVEKLVDYCLENGFHLVIKLHPKEAVGDDILGQPYNNLTYRKLEHRPRLLERIVENGFILDKGSYDTYALIEISDVCVTVNSQAGLEALIKGKDLIVCGQSFYSGLGFTFEALNRDGLVCSLDQVLVRGVSALNNTEINKFFYTTSEKYFLDKTEKSIKQLLAR